MASPSLTRWRWLSLRKLTADTLALASRLPSDLAGIVGIPRSGMLPASILATVLHLPLAQASDRGVEWLDSGSRGSFAHNLGPLLVIDDTLYSGRAIHSARNAIQQWSPRNCLYAAVYVKDASHARDARLSFWQEETGPMHLNEWHVFNHELMLPECGDHPEWRGAFAFDFDGILCHDPTAADVHSEASYARWIAAAIPRWPIRKAAAPCVITARPERYRGATGTWLVQQGMQISRLIMRPDDFSGDVAAWKAEQLRDQGFACYLESDAGLAERIARLVPLPIVCPDAEAVFDYREAA